MREFRSGERGGRATRREARAQVERDVDEAEQRHEQDRPAENGDRRIDADQHDATALQPARDPVQHRKAERRIGDQQARGQRACGAMPAISGRKEPAIAAASTKGVAAGNRMAARSGQGRLSRPEIFTMRAASQRLRSCVIVVSTAAAGGITTTRMSISRSGSETPGTVSASPAGMCICARSMRSKASRKRCLNDRLVCRRTGGSATMTTSAPRIAAHTTRRPGGYHSVSPSEAAGRASKAR